MSVLEAPARQGEIVVVPQRVFSPSDFFEGWDARPGFNDVFLSGGDQETDGQPVKVGLRWLRSLKRDDPLIEVMGGIEAVATSLPVFAAITEVEWRFVTYIFDDQGEPWLALCMRTEIRSVSAHQTSPDGTFLWGLGGFPLAHSIS